MGWLENPASLFFPFLWYINTETIEHLIYHHLHPEMLLMKSGELPFRMVRTEPSPSPRHKRPLSSETGQGDSCYTFHFYSEVQSVYVVVFWKSWKRRCKRKSPHCMWLGDSLCWELQEFLAGIVMICAVSHYAMLIAKALDLRHHFTVFFMKSSTSILNEVTFMGSLLYFVD